MILREDLRDDEGKRFRFGTHMFRRSYGVKLTELHLDDWTIAKLLGHKGVNAVMHYRKMLEDGDRISVPQLMKMTGLSRGFFYKNPIVRAEISQALEQQAGTIDPRRNILDQAMGGRIALLEQQIRELKQEIEKLQKENQKLRKGMGKQDRKAWKDL